MSVFPKNKIAPCQGACPAGVDVPRYIRFIKAGQYDQALAVIRERIPFPAVCGNVCIHPCEAMCARHQYDEPVAIRLLKRAAAEKSAAWKDPIPAAPLTNKAVAVIGAGPGGLTAAYYLAGKGHQVIVLESRPQPGGMMRYAIPEYRLPNQVVDEEIAVITSRGVKIKTNYRVKSAQALLDTGFDAVITATGAWAGSKTGAPTDSSARMIDGVSFLEQINTGQPVTTGNKVVVVGGGNTAVDVARAARRLGAQEVIIIYRRTRAEMPADPNEIRDALEEGVRFEFLAAPIKINKDQVVCTRMDLGDRDSSGRPRPVPIAGSEFTVAFDLLVEAVGQSAEAAAVGLPGNKYGAVDTGFVRSGIFAAGDVVTGPASIIEAIAQGRQAAAAVDLYLGGDGRIDEKLAADTEAVSGEPAPLDTCRTAAETIPLVKRLEGFTQVEQGFDEQAAAREAGRCLGCDIREYNVDVNSSLCKECNYCKEVCTVKVFETSEAFNESGYKPMTALHGENCVGCLRCRNVCPDFAITIN
ncbi:MAG: FAD-dependent oxidoreductase [Firmicutes bacterium]|nr:FAD-dependent oxidoreductase [Bacillota bacterium]